MLNAKPLSISGVVLVTPTRFEDDRGYFEETFNARNFAEAVGTPVAFVQDNESRSNHIGTVRGLHYQLAPAAQGKLVRVTAGAIVDVVVDLRRSSDTYLQHIAVELSGANGQQLWVPPGMAHGFCTTEPDTVIQYKVTDFYDPACDRAVSWTDPLLGIDWPSEAGAVISAKDASAPTAAEAEEAGDVFA